MTVVDFYCSEIKLAIEIDGSSHDAKNTKAYDDLRQKLIEEFGIQFLRFTNDDIKNNLSHVLNEIETYIAWKTK